MKTPLTKSCSVSDIVVYGSLCSPRRTVIPCDYRDLRSLEMRHFRCGCTGASRLNNRGQKEARPEADPVTPCSLRAETPKHSRRRATLVFRKARGMRHHHPPPYSSPSVNRGAVQPIGSTEGYKVRVTVDADMRSSFASFREERVASFAQRVKLDSTTVCQHEQWSRDTVAASPPRDRQMRHPSASSCLTVTIWLTKLC
jgi:hypothetical protein